MVDYLKSPRETYETYALFLRTQAKNVSNIFVVCKSERELNKKTESVKKSKPKSKKNINTQNSSWIVQCMVKLILVRGILIAAYEKREFHLDVSSIFKKITNTLYKTP